MATVSVINQSKEKVGTIELRDDVFGVEVNIPLVHQALKAYLANQRQGTHKTKTKSEVRGGGRKPFKQKGTGNARQGSTRSPLHPGGGQSFGPQPRDYTQYTPKEMVRGALRSALSDRLKSDRLIVMDEFLVPKPKTKLLHAVLKDQLALHDVLIVDDSNVHLERAARNIGRVKITHADSLNVYDVVDFEWLVLTKRAVQNIETRLARGKKD